MNVDFLKTRGMVRSGPKRGYYFHFPLGVKPGEKVFSMYLDKSIESVPLEEFKKFINKTINEV